MEVTEPDNKRNKRKKSNVKHTRAIQHDRSQRTSGVPTEEAMAQPLKGPHGRSGPLWWRWSSV